MLRQARSKAAGLSLLLGALAMAAFAGNSILARFALAGSDAAPWTFSLVRLLGGAVLLAGVARFRIGGGSWLGAGSLLVYITGFSYAYIALGAGMGALILFGVVQVTMIAGAVLRGERLRAVQWGGMIVAFAAMIWLVSPGGAAFNAAALILMSLAGAAWGVYSLIGRAESQPIIATAGNFVRAAGVMVVATPAALWLWPEAMPGPSAFGAALLSGAVTSGLGYAVWYAILPSLTRSRAAILQLSVPALAAVGGLVLLNEPLTLRLALSAVLMLLGVGVALLAQSTPPAGKPSAS